ncbi:hypothetical protein ACO0QE_002943 [Hanseniaspora vineae]
MLNRNLSLTCSLCSKRTITIYRTRKTNASPSRNHGGAHKNQKARKTQRTSILPNDTQGITSHEALEKLSHLNNEKALDVKINELKNFTERIKERVKRQDAIEMMQGMAFKNKNTFDSASGTTDALPHFSNTSSTELQNREILNSKTKPSEVNMVLSPNSELNVFNNDALVPSFLLDKIKDDALVYKCLINPRNRNFNFLVEKLYENKYQLKDVPLYDLRYKFIPLIRNLSFSNIEKLDSMLQDAVSSKTKTPNSVLPMCFYESIFKNLYDSHLSMPEESSFKYVISYFDNLISRYEKGLQNTPAEDMKQKFKFTPLILNHILSYLHKMQEYTDYRLMNKYIQKFQSDFGVQPNRQNYTTMIAFSVANKNTKQAWDLFDTMKFLSVKDHAPDENVYMVMLQLCNQELDYAKALDLYQELKDLLEQAHSGRKHKSKLPIHVKNQEQTQPSVAILSVLAMIMARCSKDQYTADGKKNALILKGWQFIHEIYDRTNGLLHEGSFSTERSIQRLDNARSKLDLSPYQALKSMMSLAAHDGDLTLARALYFKFITSLNKSRDQSETPKSLDPSFFNYLLCAYSRFDPKKVNTLDTYNEGIKLREQIINSCDFSSVSGMDKVQGTKDLVLPYLPKTELSNENEILLESRALWHWHIEQFYKEGAKQGHSEDCIKNYEADIACCKSLSGNSYETFERNIMVMIDKWRKETNIDFNTFNSSNLISFLHIALKMNDLQEFKLRLAKFSTTEADIKRYIRVEFENSPGSDDISTKKNRYQLYSLRHRILRGNELYLTCIKAACHFKNLEFGQEIWKERGEYRETEDFKKSISDVKNKGGQHDELFAKEVCSLFTQLGHLKDALSVVLSSRRFINWRFSDVKPLYEQLAALEDIHSLKLLKECLKKSSKKYDSNLKKLEEKLEELKI